MTTKSFAHHCLVRATYHRLNSQFLHHRNETTTMIRAYHIYCEELTKVINENNSKATCQLVHSFSRESGVYEVEVAGTTVFNNQSHKIQSTSRNNTRWTYMGKMTTSGHRSMISGFKYGIFGETMW
ncbi:hypothetical protein Lal_00030217 [Lupinus albus]|nr:hypothetical protein Lal_00030217 [Lupinus albus]